MLWARSTSLHCSVTLASEQEQLNKISKATIAEGVPKLAQFIWHQHAFTAAAFVDFGSSLHRVGFKQSLSNGPTKEAAECTTGAIAGYWTSVPLDLSQDQGNGAPVYVGQAQLGQWSEVVGQKNRLIS